jgi:delta 1-pyrroline-5-carboxylate dehydrogenase
MTLNCSLFSLHALLLLFLIISQHRFTTSSLTLPGYMPKTVSWDDKENIRFIDRVVHQKKVHRRKRMSKSREDVYKKRVEDLITEVAAVQQQKEQEVAALQQQIAALQQQKSQEVAALQQQIAALKQQVFNFELSAASSSRKSSESSDSMNTSTSSTNSAAMSEASASSADTSMTGTAKNL